MTVADIIRICEQWAPAGIAWEKDNVGLQIGDLHGRVRRILVALDVTEGVVDEARRKKIDLIITHHPLFFRPARTLTESTRQGRIARRIIENSAALLSMHTNIDFVRDGVSWILARKLNLQEIRFLEPIEHSAAKVVTFVPREAVESVTEAMSAAGAGVIGNYTECSFRTDGFGTYRPGKNSKPWSGVPEILETAEEVRVEMIVPRWRVQPVVKALLQAHPYEEVAYDVVPLENGSANYGVGAIGTFRTPLSTEKFLHAVRRVIAREGFRYSAGKSGRIGRVAVCGGDGSRHLQSAIGEGADAFITSDVTYHTFQEAEGRILLVDAGHFETERFIVPAIREYLKAEFSRLQRSIDVQVTGERTNPIYYS